ncbi:TPA: response regulator NasT [Xanthomonas vasicola pv. zeae]|uniref:Response regulator NasT n=2 Tax=Xanthomonas vasicola pv. vasculorum TaxID=325776 RepID=A0A837AP62_XANVA|nr:response regulator NasT [Xanthomonas vasicola pv. vasculorum]AZR27290.1 response regulator NasT [Xanthomonas vasicola pv. arecae]AZR30919.1 response regulator NasT [Xanthomonas vasicola pv. musacearum NCPPB 4379]AZR34997.1 response regulator NasT [Xanthomonas vasicola]KEZ95149.1 response regulator NasT [Xanthomonas vasicola pv. vasculorum NCPPB 895]KFA05256.1 response regulator NasT [Xanthomonas vasicola pv. musacearum NCPPB 4380]KFA10848.1 response regulator NasT [Xanthomonas vasicola pv.
MRVLLVNDTQKPIGELRQALTCAGYIVLDDVASVSACMNVSATAIHAAIDDGADVA